MTRLFLSFLLLQFAASLVLAQGNTPPILQKPTISRTRLLRLRRRSLGGSPRRW
jgi:hypothetical protein